MDPLTQDLTTPTIVEPKDLPVSESNRLKVAIWEKTVSAYCTSTDYLASNLKSVNAVICGQSSEDMKAKLTSLNDFKERSRDSGCAWILKKIKGITYPFEGQRYIFLSLDNARTNYEAYNKHFRLLVEVLEHYVGKIGKDPALLEAVNPSVKDPTKRAKVARDRTLVLAFLKRADRRRFDALWDDLENQYCRVNNQYAT